MPNGSAALGTSAVSSGLASRIKKAPGHNVKKSEARARTAAKERGISVPTVRQTRKTHKNFLAAGKRVGRRSTEGAFKKIRGERKAVKKAG